MFGSAASSGSGLFGSSQNKPAFGSSQSAPLSTNPLSGQGFLFGSSANNTSNPAPGGFSFGQNNQSNTAGGSGGTGGLFGQNKPQGGGLFGSSSAAPATGSTTGGGLFGAKPAASASGGSGLFGSASNTASTGGSGLFSNNSQPSTNNTSSGGLFGSKPPAASGGLFGGTNTQNNQSSQSGGLFGSGANQNTQSGGGLFGASSQSKPAGGLFGGGSSQTQGSGLFGGAGQGTQPQQQQQQQQNAPAGGGGLFGGTNTLNNSQPSFSWSSSSQPQQQQQGQQQSGLLALPSMSKLQPLSQASSVSTSSNTYTPPINDQLIKLKEQWDPNSSKCAFKTHLYNKFSPEEIQVLLQQPRPANEPPEEWDKAMSERPSPLHYPIKISSFLEVAQRIEVQLDYVAKSRVLLNNINEKQAQLSSKHDLDNSTRILKAKVRRAKLSRKLLRLATILAILKLKGYPLLPEEEEISKQFQGLNARLSDPNGSVGKLSDLYARLAILKGRSDDLSFQLESSINSMSGGLNNLMNGDNSNQGSIMGADDKNYVDQVVKLLTNLLYKQQVGLSFLNDLVQKDISIVDKANSGQE